MRRVGELIFTQVFAGSIEAVEHHGTKNASFRRLARHPQIPFGGVTLWRAVGLHCLLLRFPGSQALSTSALLISGLCWASRPICKNGCSRLAETENWSTDRLDERASARRPTNARGRPAHSPAVRSLRALTRLAEHGGLSDDLAALELLGDEAACEANDALERIRRWCDRAAEAIARRRRSAAGGA